MGELVRVADDAHGLDPAVDDVHGEDVPDAKWAVVVPALGPNASSAVGELLAHERREALRVAAGLQERLCLLDRAPLGLAILLGAPTAQHATGLAIDPHELRLELAEGPAHTRHAGHEARDDGGAEER